MPLVKIWTNDRTLKKFMRCSTLNDLKLSAATKFGWNIVEDTVNVVLESDGTEVEDDEVFQEIIMDNPSCIFTVLRNREVWLSPDSVNAHLIVSSPPAFGNGASPSVTTCTASPSTSTGADSPCTANMPAQVFANVLKVINPDEFAIPWRSFPAGFIILVEKKRVPNPKDFRDMMKVLGIEIGRYFGSVKPKSNFLENIARTMVAKYPDSLEDRICNKALGKGWTTLFQVLEHKIENDYRNSSIKVRTGNRGEATKSLKRGKTCKDSYGCIAWEPEQYPDEETSDSQKAKQMALQNYMLRGPTQEVEDNSNAEYLMNLTYRSQRLYINGKSTVLPPKISDIKIEWPLLCEFKHMVKHFQMLTGKDIIQQYNTEIGEKASTIVRYIRKKSSNKIVKTVLNDIQENCITQKSRIPEVVGICHLVCAYLGEEIGYLIQNFEVSTPPEHIVSSHKMPRSPCLAVLGNLFEENVKCYVVIEGIVIGDITCFNQAMQILLGSFYCFNLVYPSEVEATLEFFQRYILDINPPRGTKRGGKKKRTNIHPKVLKLCTGLQAFNTARGSETDSDP